MTRARSALWVVFAVSVAAAIACGPKPPPPPPARPSLDPGASPSGTGTPDPRLKQLDIARVEPDPVKRAEKLAAIAKGAPPSDPVARAARVALVRTWALAGKLDEMHKAAGDLEIADDSEGADLLNVMAYAYADAGKSLERAHQYSQRALEVVLSLRRPDGMPAESWKRQIAAVIAAYRDTLGWVLFKGGDFRGAVREIGQSADVLPDDPTINWHLGQALLAAGKPADAIAALVRSAVGEGDESAPAKALALASAEKAGLTAADIEKKVVDARAALEAKVKAAATAKRLTEEPKELTSADASGADYRAELVCFENRGLFPEQLEIGMAFEGLPEGAATPDMPADAIYVVTEIYPSHVVLDGNHPLAGLALRLQMKVCDVRAASEEEIGARSVGSGPASLFDSAGANRQIH